MSPRLLAAAVLVVLVAGSGGVASALETVGPARLETGNGRKLDPAGRMTKVGAFPTGGALTPDGRFYWAVDAGRGANFVHVVDVGTGKVKQKLPLPGGYVGIAFSPDGRHAYVSGQPAEGPQPPAAKATDGNVIHVYDVAVSGAATERDPIPLPKTRDGAAAKDELPGASGVPAWPEGLDVTPDGKRLVVALGQADQAAIIDLGTLQARLVDVGRYPYGAIADPHRDRAYISNERDGTVSAIDLGSGKVLATIEVGGPRGSSYAHAEGLSADPKADRVYVAVTDRDLVAVIDTKRLRVARSINVTRKGTALGTAPVSTAVAPDGRTLYVADAGEDAVVGVALTGRRGVKAYSLLGRLPTAAYTTDVAASKSRLVWLAAKGLGTGPNPKGESIKELTTGRVGVLPRPTDRAFAALTARADRQVVPANARRAPAGTPIVGPGGGASRKIKHVFYVVKENRTYDQLFGSDPRGRGNPRNELFDDNGVAGPAGGVTPNAHALSRRFALYDNVYANSEESTAGHKITAGGYANDYLQRYTFTKRGRKGNPDIFAIGSPPNAFVFDQAVRQGVSQMIYGELGGGNQALADDGRPTFKSVQGSTEPSYPSQVLGTCSSGNASIPVSVRCTTDAGDIGGTHAAPATNSRMRAFAAKFTEQDVAGKVPAFNYVLLFNDHTNGTDPGRYTPKADMADNDLALGQLVELVSHSSVWKDSAILVVEDDSQDGIDSVDAHRMPVQVISPWAKTGGRAISTRYDHYSFLRTAELILGLRPLSINDALATPLYDAFLSGNAKPDVEGTRYTAIQPQQSLTEVNGADAPNARLSAALPWDATDLVPQRLSDEILWQSVYGAGSRVPPAGPGASVTEADRTTSALRAYRAGRSVRRALSGEGEGEEEDAARARAERALRGAGQIVP